jgi:hypothetical protein
MPSPNVPFYPNHEDNMSCMLAVYASMVDYFLHKKLSRQELIGITGYRSGIAAWSVTALINLAKMGLDIKMIEPFDYERYLREGRNYLKEYYKPEELEWTENHSNILEMGKDIPVFLESISYQKRRPRLGDFDEMLAGGRLVFVTVNSRALNYNPGYVSHAILVIRKEGDDYIVHDPGLPPHPNRRVSKELLWQAMGGDKTTSEVTGFKLKAA